MTCSTTKPTPPDVAAVLDALGIKDVGGWRRGPDIAAPPSYRIAYVCQCAFVQVFVTPAAIRGYELMLGQCPNCGVVHWGVWVSKDEEWPRSRPGRVKLARRRAP